MGECRDGSGSGGGDQSLSVVALGLVDQLFSFFESIGDLSIGIDNLSRRVDIDQFEVNDFESKLVVFGGLSCGVQAAGLQFVSGVGHQVIE